MKFIAHTSCTTSPFALFLELICPFIKTFDDFLNYFFFFLQTFILDVIWLYFLVQKLNYWNSTILCFFLLILFYNDFWIMKACFCVINIFVISRSAKISLVLLKCYLLLWNCVPLLFL
jgi:hypothetical protein